MITHTTDKTAAAAPIQLLDDTLMREVLEYVGPGTYFYIASISKQFEKVYLKTFPEKKTYYKSAVVSAPWAKLAINNYHWVKKLKYSYSATGSLCYLAPARKGNLHILQWVTANGWPWDDNNICYTAVARAYLELMQWARENGCPWHEYTSILAIEEGLLKVLKWAKAKGCDWDESVCMFAAEAGYLKVLKWATKNRCPWNEWTCENAAARGHFKCFNGLQPMDALGMKVPVKLLLKEVI